MNSMFQAHRIFYLKFFCLHNYPPLTVEILLVLLNTLYAIYLHKLVLVKTGSYLGSDLEYRKQNSIRIFSSLLCNYFPNKHYRNSSFSSNSILILQNSESFSGKNTTWAFNGIFSASAG